MMSFKKNGIIITIVIAIVVIFINIFIKNIK